MKTKIYFALLLTTGILSISRAQPTVIDPEYNTMLQSLLTHTVTEVIPDDLEKDSTIVFLDAREKPEYEVSHIKDALWVGYTTFKLKRVAEINKDQKIVVYCSVGFRSEKIAEKLEKAGFTSVSNLYGGIFEWVHKDHKVYNTSGETTTIHAFDKEWSQWLHKGEKVY